MSRQVATFATPYDADWTSAPGRPMAVKVIAIIVDGENEIDVGVPTVTYVVVDHDHGTSLVPSAELLFTDQTVQPPRYG